MLLAAEGRADGTADEADLQFRLGAAEFQRGSYEAALEHFFVSNRLAPNRNVLFNIGSAFEHMKSYADAHRYYTDALDGETDPQAVKADEAALARITPRVAVLDVATDPPGATLYLDRKSLGSVGSAPRLLALPPGRYKVLAELDGYESAESGEVEARLGNSSHVELSLKRIIGTVRIAVSGALQAAVRVDDERAAPRCTAPCDLALAPGEHELFFAADGYRAPSRTVIVNARAVTTATALMTPLTGSVLVEADEPGALITVDGQPAGFTPSVIQNVRVGQRHVHVALHGYLPADLEVLVQADKQAQPPPLKLEPVHEVEAVSRYKEDIDDAPSSVTIITGEELRAFAYPTIAEALRGVRGFTISNDRAYPSASVRGLGQPEDYGNRLLVLSDGQSLNDDIDGSSHIGSDGRIDLGDVDRIEVVRGPGSLLYGAGALSGVVNLVSRPRDEPDSAGGSIGVYDGATVHARANFHKGFGEGRGMWASVSGAQSNGQDLLVPLTGAAPASTGGVDAFTGVNTAGRAWDGPLTLQWFFNRRNQSVPVGAYGTDFGDPGTKLLDTRSMAELRYEPKLTDSLQLLLRGNANRSVSSEEFQATPYATERYEGIWYGAEARLAWTPRPGLRLTAGGEGQVHPVVVMHGQTLYSADAGSYLDVHAPYHFSAGYLIADATLAPWMKFSGGARVDNYSTFGSIVVPRGALIVRPVEGGTLKLMGGRAFRAPSVYEQNYNDGGQTQMPAVDPSRGLSLSPESIWSGEVEYSQRFHTDWVALVDGYLSRVQDIIAAGPDSDGSALIRFQNSRTPVVLAGVEAELRRELRNQVMLSLSYGYQRARYLTTQLADTSLVNAPEHLAAFKAIVPIAPDIALLGLRATLEAPRRIDLATSDNTGTSLILDATISGTLRGLGTHYTAGVYNLADQRVQVPVSSTFLSRTIPQNGRTLLFQLDGSF